MTVKSDINRHEVPGYSAKYIVGYTHYLVMKAQLAGNLTFDGHKASIDEQYIALRLREFSKVIERRLTVCSVDDISDLLECYDLAFRIGYKRLPDESRISRYINRLFRAWKSNKKIVEESSVFRVVSSELSRQKRDADKDLTDAGKYILEKWITDLLLHSSFPDASSFEAYQRLSLLMPLNLNHYIGDEDQDLKRRWFESFKVEDLSSLDTYILRSYRRFIGSLPIEVVGFEEQKLIESKVLRELSGRKDLDPYDREAFQMALKFTEELIHA